MGQASPNEVIHHKNKIVVFMDTQKRLHEDSPMNLSLTHIDFFYFTFYCPVASAAGSVNEDKSCSVSGGTAFGSVKDGTMFDFDPGSAPYVGWTMSS